MPYSKQHKQNTRTKIIETARILFNRHGFDDVTIDLIMKTAGLTRGGFYNHFKSKDELYGAAVSSFLMGRGAKWHAQNGVDPTSPSLNMTRQMIEGYLSPAHLGDLDGQCPMIALPSDIARSNPAVQASYQELLQAMVGFFEQGFDNPSQHALASTKAREKALGLAALCVGGMVLARTLPNSTLAKEVRVAALQTAQAITTKV